MAAGRERVMVVLGWWRRRSHAARFDLSVRWSFYLNFAFVPFLVAVGLAPELGAAVWLVLALIGVHVLLCVQLVRAGLDNYLGRGPRPTALIAATAALTAAGTAGGYLAYPEVTPGHPDGPANGILLILNGCFVAALATAVRPRVTALAAAAACAAAYTLSALQGAPVPDAVVAFGMLLTVVALAGRVSAWMLGLVWELDRAREVQASLAVAEERFRFARDLHDVVGRTLSTIALKAELAAQLARRGQDTAIDEMLEVRRVAQESMTELRAVVGGYRSANLDVELAGARSLLASAGIECRMIGESGGLPEPVRTPLGWAVREGVTNVLRHSDARNCTIALRPGASGTVTLTIENDGVRGEPAPDGGRVRFGGGLVGLAERAAGLGGTVAADRLRERFRLTVELPTRAVAAAEEGPA
ncbi:sensor histidine kinase [Micromonospora sp. CPCC 206061]|uniref:sensor histidine kinase n=1 Tax=Micromonospora sp. CPCC 206061 TaxID=3122410 RepID=UPI002FF083C6